MSKYHQIAQLLIDLECSLRNMALWRDERPSAEALASQQPFCIDTLDFNEWLQFVFIERMQLIIAEEMPLPTKCGLAPMAEEYFRGSAQQPRALIRQLEEIDRTLSN